MPRLFGTAFVATRGERPYLHSESGSRFIAQPLLSAYTLLLAFPDDVDFEKSGCLPVLAKAIPMLCELIRRLPPPDGGPPALAQGLRGGQGGGAG